MVDNNGTEAQTTVRMIKSEANTTDQHNQEPKTRKMRAILCALSTLPMVSYLCDRKDLKLILSPG